MVKMRVELQMLESEMKSKKEKKEMDRMDKEFEKIWDSFVRRNGMTDERMLGQIQLTPRTFKLCFIPHETKLDYKTLKVQMRNGIYEKYIVKELQKSRII